LEKVEVKSPTNIALIKYWGKHPKYEHLLIPTKSSISFTVARLATTTNLAVESGSLEIQFTLNGRKIEETQTEFDYVREFFDRISSFYPFAKRFRYVITSRNDFPTASGFASSAAGFSALALCFAGVMTKLGKLPPMDDRKLSVLARLGSGSAARSVPSKGGLVLWHRGFDDVDTEDEASARSYAETLFEPSYFEELAIIYAKVESEKEKVTKSRAGMKESVRTVYDYWNWVDYEEKRLLPEMLDAIRSRNWTNMFNLTKQASNNFHSVCIRTVPPIVYLSDKSIEIMRAIDPLPHAAYTFDAGPNAVVFTLKEKADEVDGALKNVIGNGNTVITHVGEGPKTVLS
jgi:diphosphomevalonate decarboxylase